MFEPKPSLKSPYKYISDSMVSIELANDDFESLKSLAEMCLDSYILQKSAFDLKYKKKDFVLLFALHEGKKVGFITGYGEGSGMHIWLLGVNENNRGKGIGEALLEEFEQFAKEKGYLEITTLTFNKYKGKLTLSLRKGFNISGYKFLDAKNDYGIELTKKLN